MEPVLNERAQHLLKVLVENYIREGLPMGSRTLARIGGLELSPATIRNVMADLEEMGLIHSPHTSAGRIPTAQGYRVFVDHMLRCKPLDPELIESLEHDLDPAMTHQSLVKTASDLLSGITQLAAVVTVPRTEFAQLRQIEFLGLSENRALAILVIDHKEVQNRIIQLDRPYSAGELQAAANLLNERFAGRDLREIRHELVKEMDQVRRDMNALMASVLELGGKVFEDEELEVGDMLVVGQTHLMEYQELSDVEKLRQLFEVFASKQEILHLLDRCIWADGVQIFIGQESEVDPLDACSVISTPYAVRDGVIGVLGVIGPTRMAYDRVIPVVDITAKLLGAALNADH